ncbi:nucleotidyltransferase family protein [Frigidibacter sp. RF13]|uniref:nucleotidyltransferase family protein n=1 Tax=Frigidibacter sp. RF13 TaxID=2997340 RepID=UPI0022720516|nr:nucleotidyltransferase family protein [Frigidibacter sp. RF13]MCY1128184.1 nucleotidyltransferase family protein [Frigidibacter sp. RF13]
MPPDHLRFAAWRYEEQRAALFHIVRESPVLMRTLQGLRALDLPDSWLVSGAIYNQVWNHLTGRPEMHGVKDIDLFYFDPDTSYEAEDREIRRAAALFPPEPPVELRNQARVHLWYESHFGQKRAPLPDSRTAIEQFACLTHCVGLRLEADGNLTLHAPHGLGDIFAFRLTPNPCLPNRATHEAKAARQKSLWPELEVVPWPD